MEASHVSLMLQIFLASPSWVVCTFTYAYNLQMEQLGLLWSSDITIPPFQMRSAMPPFDPSLLTADMNAIFNGISGPSSKDNIMAEVLHSRDSRLGRFANGPDLVRRFSFVSEWIWICLGRKRIPCFKVLFLQPPVTLLTLTGRYGVRSCSINGPMIQD